MSAKNLPTALWARLTKYKVTNWGADSSEMASGEDRQAVEQLGEAQVVSSHIIGTPKRQDDPSPLESIFSTLGDFHRRHQIVLDVDHPAWLVPSSTPGHHHLYVEIPDGVPEPDYFEFLDAAAKIGLIEPGYANVSKQRGHTDVRLPWVTKDGVDVDEPKAIKDGHDASGVTSAEIKPEDLSLTASIATQIHDANVGRVHRQNLGGLFG